MAKGSKKKKKSQVRIKTTRLAMVLIAFVVLILMAVLFILSSSLHKKIEIKENLKSDYEKMIEDEKARSEDIEALEDHMKSDEYIEQVAKDKLGMVNDGEIIFKESK